MVVLLLEDNPEHAELAKLELKAEGIDTVHFSSAESALEYLHGHDVDVVLSDHHLPGMSGMEFLEQVRRTWPHVPVVLVTGMGNEQLAVAAMKAGACDYLIKEARLGYLQMLATVVRNSYEKNRLLIEVQRLRRQAAERSQFSSIIGTSPAMQEVFRLLEAIVPTNATVLITGESGTGKELVARAIHYNGPRAAGPVVACNCGAIPETLVESELFGHERGAFTGAATRRLGSFESANHGTLFLDEVSELPPVAQVSLLRAVQERQIRRLGGNGAIDVDVRIVAACNRDLWELVQQGLFREDLYYRLNVLTVELPPLRDRGSDLALLAQHFVEQYARENNKPVRGFLPECLQVLERYSWPGNIRELQHCVQRAVILAGGEWIGVQNLPAAVRGDRVPAPAPRERKSYNLMENERALIEEVLEATNWNISRAAQRLGATRSTLYSKIQRHGLVPPAHVQFPTPPRRFS
jgi:DNA-binding NtrC family response regulator